MAQLGQSARLGAVRSQVRILLPRFISEFYLSYIENKPGHSPRLSMNMQYYISNATIMKIFY